ncbi:MAG: TonB-dependent receptor [Cytophagaceae bacterium]|nr:TonB-dependent receptor [Cytophagaceae bacterium]MDW8456198.1 hypothetical protein [Cytophagaceae bacterium]
MSPFQIPSPNDPILRIPIENIRLKAVQNGATLSLNMAMKKLQLKPFITIQQTKVYDMPRYFNSPLLNTAQNVTMVYDTIHPGTPTMYGGAFINYQAISKLNLNLNMYYYGKYTYYSIASSFAGLPPNVGNINVSSKYFLNARVSYRVLKQLETFVSASNLLNQDSFEFAQTDKIRMSVYGGLNFEF